MKKLIFGLLAVLIAFTSIAQDKASALDKSLAEKFPATNPGASVLVVQKGKVVLRKGYGMANLEKNEAITPEHVFRIGSVTKQFTSTAILKLAAEKKINLSDNITKYLPDFQTGGVTITIEHLLNHTSGLKSYTSLDEIMAVRSNPITIPAMLEVIQKQPHDFAPGEQYMYNNSAYFMLGAIIEKVSGMSYDAYITKNFFKPLKMTSSFVTDENLPSNNAAGYVKSGATEYTTAVYVHPSIPYSAGSIFSTVDDLLKWNQGLFSGKVLKKEWLEKAWNITTLKNGTQISYGYGWQLGRIGQRKVIGHGGAIDGFLSFELYVPDEDLYICVLENSSTINPEEIAYELAEISLDIKSKKPEPITLDAQKLDEYAGVYKINDQEDRVIRRSGNGLTSQRTGGSKFELYPYQPDGFAFKDTRSTLQFIRDEKGKVVAAELIGNEWVTQRVPKTDKPIPAEVVEVQIDPVTFDPYVGEYELAPGFIIKVWREDKSFKAQATGQPSFDIFPKSENEFFLKVVDAQIVFNRDDQGKVASLTLLQGGRQMPGKKIK
jgi:CubicO group peptidase (beta-lactamase class C family)